MSAIIIALYAWAFFGNVRGLATGLIITTSSAILAGTSLLLGIASYFWIPQKYAHWGSFAAFGVLSLATGILILTTGGVVSPFIALWMVISVFAGLYGWYGLLPFLVATLGYMVAQSLQGLLTREAIMTVIFAGELPLAASYMIWHSTGKDERKGSDAYHELATELSQVAGKSEIVINAIADGVIALNGQGAIQLINPAAEQLTGWNKQDAMTLNYKSIFKLLDKNEHEITPATDPVSQALATNKEVSVTDLTLITNAGKKLLVSVIVSPVGQPGAGVIVVFRDITKERHEERQQAEFISTAAHEMRTPVASIEGYLGLALNPATAQVDEKARDFINKAHASAQHLGNLFQDLLDVSKAEDGRLTNNPKVVDVVEFTHDIVEGLKPKATEKGLHVLFKPQPDDAEDRASERRLNPVFYANLDNDHLREVIANLVENAIKYTPKGDVVIDVTGDENDHVIVSIADSGIGIPKEDQAHLFQKFYRVDNSDTREIGGTGLGLYLCRRLVEAMNGRIWVDSEYKQGSTFYVELPRIDHEEATRLIEAAGIEKTNEIEEVKIETPPPLPQLTSPEPQPAPASIPTQIPVQAPQSVPAGEAVYTTTPASQVVQQLQAAGNVTTAPTAVQQQPIYQQTQGIPAAPVYQPQAQQGAYQQQYPQQQYQAAPQPTYQRQQPVRVNVPLTSIEQNPGQYLRERGNVPVPPRNQN